MTATLAASIVALLKANALVAARSGGRIYPDTAPQGVAVPYVIYSEISTTPEESQDDCNGLDTTEIQFAAYADTTLAAVSLRQALRSALTPPGALPGVVVMTPSLRTQPADDLRLSNASLDLTFIHHPNT